MLKKRLIAIVICIGLILPLFSQITAHAGKYYLLWPVPGHYGITSCYGDNRSHWAIDIAAPMGAPVIASAAGQVIAVNTSCTHNYGKRYNCCDSRGNYVLVRNTSPINGQRAEVRYIHLKDVYVKVGDMLSAGQQLGTVGSTGYSTGAHLDYKLILNGIAADPGPYLQIPSGLYYAGNSWECCGPYMAKLKSYNNTEYDPGIYGGVVLKSGYNYPILLLKGNHFAVNGTITSNKKLSSVELRVITPNGNVKTKASANPNATSYNLSNLASKLRFKSLAQGYYIYEVLARDESMSSYYRLLYSPFTVSDKATIAPMFGYTHPICIKPGQSFSLKGNIASINPISSINVSVVSQDGKKLINKTVSTNTTLYNLANIDKDIKFNTLPEGTYFYQVKGTDNKGNQVTAINETFYVSNKTAILGEIMITGFFLAPAPNNRLTLKAELEPANASYKVQWFADGKPINGANSLSFTPTFAQKGAAISAKITGTGNYIGEIESSPTNKVFSLTNKSFQIDLVSQTVTPAPLGTSVKMLMNNLVSDFMFTGVFDKDGKELAGDTLLVTGHELKALIGRLTIYRYFVVIQGDLNGDSAITAQDARLALRGSANVENLKNYQKKAGDINNDGKLTAADARMILRVSAKIDTFPDII